MASVSGENVAHSGMNRFLFGKAVIWQTVPIGSLLRVPVLVVELNPRLINTWILVLIRRLLKRKTLAWGHVFPRAGEDSPTETLRNALRELLDGMIVYTEGEAAAIRRKNPRLETFVAFNSIYSRSEMTPRLGSERRDFVMSGRLVPGKKPALAAAAFELFYRDHPRARLVLIGNGPERERIEKDFGHLVESGALLFLGEVTEPDALSDAYETAVALVAAGYVGLNATQSLGFGVPVVFPLDEPHAPEVEVLDDHNSWKFSADDIGSLRSAMNAAWDARHIVDAHAIHRSAATAETYSIESMARAFERAAS